MTASAAQPPRPESAGESSAEPPAGARTDPAPPASGEPAAAQSDAAQPAVPESAVPEPDSPESAVPEPDSREPAAPEPAAPEPAAPEPAGPEPAGPGPEPGIGDVAAAAAAAPSGAGPRPRGMRLSRAVTLVLLAALGFGGVVAARSADPSFSLATARPDELAASLGAIGAEDRALASQEARLRREAAGAGGAASPGASPAPGGSSGPGRGPGATADAASGAGAGAGAAGGADAERARADELAILAGTVPVGGPGLELTIRDPHRAVDASVLVDALQELRDAGAEAIEIAGVRAIVSTYIADEPGHGLIVDGTSVAAPYVLRVVGDAHTLDQALRIPGGVLDTVAARDGAQASVRTFGHLEIRALRPAPSPRYARPAG
ncbi:DUF881 domain-containing protein [Frankia sp. ACN10a]|uniref:DUF881 domain-containing protein n=1 Tax=Frankia sp. ACN10a TaxID=2926031 RepID=UPI002118DEF7|nr:DUF881 domain-containing protein [Frankia sp. ACN10a]